MATATQTGKRKSTAPTRTGKHKPAAPKTATPKKHKGTQLPKLIERAEAAKLLAALDVGTFGGLRNRVAFQLMYRCGLRVAEVGALRLGHVNLKEGLLHVWSGKGDKDRTVPIPPETIELCARWLEVRTAKAVAGDWFACTKKGKGVMQNYLRRELAMLSKETGVYLQAEGGRKPVHPHTLRHCCATEMLEDGAPLTYVQQVMGHSSLQHTAIYLHVRPLALAEWVRNRPPMMQVAP